MSKRAVAALSFAVLLLIPSAARAQTPLADILVQMLLRDITLAPPPAGGTNHQAHFVSGTVQQEAAYVFNQALVTQLATFPTGSSSGGFTFLRNPQTGQMTRTSDSFGPSFSERALTVGRGGVTFGMNYQTSSYSRYNKINTENGDVKFYLRHSPIAGLYFEGDVIQAALKLKLSASTASFFLNYGLTDRFDVSATIPLVHASLDATADATVLRLATGNTPGAPIHVFQNGTATNTYHQGGSSTGVGDILLKAKYRLKDMNAGGLAIGADVRMPTGSAENLLGTGAAQTTFTFIGSSKHGRIAPHFNVGYTVSGDSDVIGSIPNELGYRFGAEMVVSPSLTVSADVIGRSMQDASKLALSRTTINYRDFNGVSGSTSFDEFKQETGTLNSVSIAFGGKFNIRGNLLFAANVLVPANWSGIRARVTPVVGFEYSFDTGKK